MKTEFYPDLDRYIHSIIENMDHLPSERKLLLQSLGSSIQDQIKEEKTVNLLFVCTHNSRRSHFGQIWAAVAATYFQLDHRIKTFSGGTEVTAFNTRAVEAVKRAGCQVKDGDGENPHYQVGFCTNHPPLECFSKRFDDPSIPGQDLIAIMTCSEADSDCPYIRGAKVRIPLHYRDPKSSDGTPEERETYDERCRQIAKEMFYVMSQI